MQPQGSTAISPTPSVHGRKKIMKIKLKNCLSYHDGDNKFVTGNVYDVNATMANKLLATKLFEVTNVDEKDASKDGIKSDGVIILDKDKKTPTTEKQIKPDGPTSDGKTIEDVEKDLMSDKGKKEKKDEVKDTGFKCKYCGREFKTALALKIHIGRSHKAEKKAEKKKNKKKT